MTPLEQALGNSGKTKLTFNRKKPLADDRSGRGSHLLRLLWGEGRQEKGHTVEETQILIITND